MTGTPAVSVVLPTHNRAPFLSAALWSALSQVDVDLEMIVVDDASTDVTPALLAREPDPRLRVIRNDHRQGVAASRNRALHEASGQWFAFLDDDDLWAPHWLRTALDTAGGVGPALIYGARLIIDEVRRVFAATLAPDPASVGAGLQQSNVLGGPSAIIVHRDIVAEVGGFDERLSALADWEAWMRFAAPRQPIAVPEFLVGYTVYPDNMHRRDPFSVLEEFRRFCVIVAAQHGREAVPPERSFCCWLAADAVEMRNFSKAAHLYSLVGGFEGSRGLLRVLRRSLNQKPSPPSAFAAPSWLLPFSACAPHAPGVGLPA